MRFLSWSLYFLGIAVLLLEILNPEVGAHTKSVLVAAALFVGAILAALPTANKTQAKTSAPSSESTATTTPPLE